MTISYNWLCDYLPEKIEPEKLSKILTSIGLEVESLHAYESVKGGLQGLVTGEVLTCEKHPDADKLKLTTVNTGNGTPLQIVCGASNVAAGQKVIVATVGTTVYPVAGDPITIKKAKIRGVESQGMICAEDEIGLGSSHEGIMVLPADTAVGKPVTELFEVYKDHIIEIGLTPNRMDAMSHLGVARDVCAYLTHHNKRETKLVSPFKNTFKPDSTNHTVEVAIENETDCRRYAGVYISGIAVAESPVWLKQRLTTIGLKPISNIVDITNFILHETGQPLHAFDAAKITGNKIIVKSAKEGEKFRTLDDKERILKVTDLMICNDTEAMCIAGVYGGIHSGVNNETKDVFLESAWFNPVAIRKTSVQHGLRTDAATRFEKGVDISNTVNVLKRAAEMIREICGGQISSNIVDVYPQHAEKVSVGLKYHYLKKLSGKNYHGEAVKNILTALGFEIMKDNMDELWVNVPFSKPDISMPADIVEEVMRIDGLDNIEIPSVISISPSVDVYAERIALKEKTANYLTGLGFSEIFTNSLTNSGYYGETELSAVVKLKNSLSAGLDIMRPLMLETGLDVMAHNINRKNDRLQLFEFGKTYSSKEAGVYTEQNHLALYLTGNITETGWQQKQQQTDFYYLKGVLEKLLSIAGLDKAGFEKIEMPGFNEAVFIQLGNRNIGVAGMISAKKAAAHDVKQPVFYADLYWDEWAAQQKSKEIRYKEIAKFPAVERDLALVVDKTISYAEIEKTVEAAKIIQLRSVRLFDVFESEKLGANKKSMAVNFTFLDETKTLTDKEIESFMNKITGLYQKNLGAEIRK